MTSDLIDMKSRKHQNSVYRAMKAALKRDRARVNVLPISELGLVQMTRKRTRKSLTSILCEPCFYCEGEGYLVSRHSTQEVVHGAGGIDYHNNSFYVVGGEFKKRLYLTICLRTRTPLSGVGYDTT